MLPFLSTATPDGRSKCVGVVALLHGGAELQEELVHLRAELDDAVRIALDHVDVAFPVDRARVLPVGIELLAVELAVAAGHHQVAGGVEHHDRLGAAVEHVDAILRVDRDARDAGLIGRRPVRAGALPVWPVARRAAACASRSAGGGGAFFKPKNSPGGSFGQFGTSL